MARRHCIWCLSLGGGAVYRAHRRWHRTVRRCTETNKREHRDTRLIPLQSFASGDFWKLPERDERRVLFCFDPPFIFTTLSPCYYGPPVPSDAPAPASFRASPRVRPASPRVPSPPRVRGQTPHRDWLNATLVFMELQKFRARVSTSKPPTQNFTSPKP
jgi:hypothetical protein